MMQIIINGKTMDAEEGTTLAALVRDLKLDPATLVAELNGGIVPREEYDRRTLSAGDRLELVRMVGGG